MFFENEILSFNILEVLELKQKNINTFNTGRNFSTISFRFCADTYLKTEKEEYYVKDNFVSFVPSKLDYSRVSNVDELIAIHFDTTNYHTENIELFIPKDPYTISKLFREILDCWNRKDVGYKYRCSAILYNIFAECHIQNSNKKPQSSKIQRSVEYIQKNYKSGNLTMQKIAKESFMSEVYFRKLFKAEYGISPQKYIIKLRIQNAIGLISTGYYSLKEVADMSGYNDYKYFSVEFKKIVGVSPSEYSCNYHAHGDIIYSNQLD